MPSALNAWSLNHLTAREVLDVDLESLWVPSVPCVPQKCSLVLYTLPHPLSSPPPSFSVPLGLVSILSASSAACSPWYSKSSHSALLPFYLSVKRLQLLEDRDDFFICLNISLTADTGDTADSFSRVWCMNEWVNILRLCSDASSIQTEREWGSGRRWSFFDNAGRRNLIMVVCNTQFPWLL